MKLQIFVEEQDIDKCDYAMQSLKESMIWDEKRFDLEYDLDIYMIVAVSDFNMGAMENKGLNIFNSKYVLANKETGYVDLRQYPLKGVRKIDDYTFEINIKGQYTQFQYWLSMPFFAPIPWEADKFYSQPDLLMNNITLIIKN